MPTADDDKLEFGAPGSGFAFPWAVPVACRRTHAPHAASALLCSPQSQGGGGKIAGVHLGHARRGGRAFARAGPV